jgi:hypothetical protein
MCDFAGRVHSGAMKKILRVWVEIALGLFLVACSSSKTALTAYDATADQGIGTGGTGSGGVGSGGVGGTDGTGSGGMGSGGMGGSGTGGSSSMKDAGLSDGVRDQSPAPDMPSANDAEISCDPGYPVGSSRPMGDGCNTCYCGSNGSWWCTIQGCPGDAGSDRATDTSISDGGCGGSGCSPDAGTPDAAKGETGTGACSQATTSEACQARSDCHAVYDDPRNCTCLALGCCARFHQCADGAKATCSGDPQCERMAPYCEGPYVVSYTATCYEGCVLAGICAE